MLNLRHTVLQILFYSGFALILAYLSQQPSYHHHDPANALVKVSFSHAGVHKEDCRQLTPEELAKLAPNMRRPISCNRERLPILVELVIDNKVIFSDSLPPAGLSGDGESTIYRRFPVAAGPHIITARLRDSHRTEGFDYELSREVELQPKQNFVIDFKTDTGGFIFL